jgi:drug/metabolite transporter (DMT)-like permease
LTPQPSNGQGNEHAAGLACAAAAGLCWGLIFLVPLLLPDYPAALLAAGRYTAFGLVACVLAWPARHALRQLHRTDWIEAIQLSAVGNIVYYSCVAAAVQLADGPLTAVIIGTLPVSIALVANASHQELPWRRLLPALGVIGAGIALVGHEALGLAVGHAPQITFETRQPESSAFSGPMRTVAGATLAFFAVGCWTRYAISNARWMKRHPHVSAATWTTAQGLMTLPLALITWAAVTCLSANFTTGDQGSSSTSAWLGPQPGAFVLWMLALGLFASWLGTQLWSIASRRLSVPLMGQLIVFETLSGLGYVYVWRGAWPDLWVSLGVGLLVGGVALAVRSAYGHPEGTNGVNTRTESLS